MRSRAGVPANARGSVLDFLLTRFPQIPAEVWQRRLRHGLVQDAQGRALRATDRIAGHSHILYEREVENEPEIPFNAPILFQSDHLLVADKPHFLPVMPAGQYVQQTLLHRLQQQTGISALSPLHRIDRDTAGLVMFSTNPASRNAYHALFRERRVTKVYHAIAPFDARFLQWHEHHSRLEEDPEKFFRMRETAGEANSHTRLQIQERQGAWARYRLEPVTGKRHQLRVHMASLGVPIRNDAYYPCLNEPSAGDYTAPLQLLARQLSFVDPLSFEPLNFESQRDLQLGAPEHA